MKKLLLILFCLPMIGFGQAGKSIQEYTSLNGDSAIECIEHDSLEFTRIMSQRMGVKYKGKPFTGTKCGYFNEDTKRIVSPKVYIEGKIYGYSYDYYETSNNSFHARLFLDNQPNPNRSKNRFK